jgi:hypothetical protein
VSTLYPNQRPYPDQRPWPHHHPQPDDPGFDAWYDSLDDDTRAAFENRHEPEPGTTTEPF